MRHSGSQLLSNTKPRRVSSPSPGTTKRYCVAVAFGLILQLHLLFAGDKPTDPHPPEVQELTRRYGDAESYSLKDWEKECPIIGPRVRQDRVGVLDGEFVAYQWHIDDGRDLIVYERNGRVGAIGFVAHSIPQGGNTTVYPGADEPGWLGSDIVSLLDESGWSGRIGPLLACDTVATINLGRASRGYYYRNGMAEATETPLAGRSEECQHPSYRRFLISLVETRMGTITEKIPSSPQGSEPDDSAIRSSTPHDFSTEFVRDLQDIGNRFARRPRIVVDGFRIIVGDTDVGSYKLGTKVQYSVDQCGFTRGLWPPADEVKLIH